MNQDRQSIDIVEEVEVVAGSVVSEADRSHASKTDIGTLIINADDWGRNVDTTDHALACVMNRAVSSVSAMVFMEDSERAAHLTRLHSVDAGLHLNFTTPFSAPQCPLKLMEHQQRCTHFLRSHRLAPVIYHPGLAASFRYLVEAQADEFVRLYGYAPKRVDGHHHMHLCANILLRKLLPAGIIVRRNFSFLPGEKGFINRAFRRWQDRALTRRYRMADCLFPLAPLNPTSRLERIFALASRYNIEIETHPVNPDEFDFLMDGGLMRCIGQTTVARSYLLRADGVASQVEGYS
jgi:predicted glycoside hydrolase/deacetylase ChbG (UPF0249 family)